MDCSCFTSVRDRTSPLLRSSVASPLMVERPQAQHPAWRPPAPPVSAPPARLPGSPHVLRSHMRSVPVCFSRWGGLLLWVFCFPQRTTCQPSRDLASWMGHRHRCEPPPLSARYCPLVVLLPPAISLWYIPGRPGVTCQRCCPQSVPCVSSL